MKNIQNSGTGKTSNPIVLFTVALGRNYFIKTLFLLACLYSSCSLFAQTDANYSSFTTDKMLLNPGNNFIRTDSIIPNDKTTPHKYKINYGFTIPFCIVATAADIYAIPKIIHAKTDLTDQEVMAVNPHGLSGFDRWALTLNPADRTKFYNISDYTLPGIIVASGIGLALDKQVRSDWWRILLMYYEMHAVTFTLYNFSFFGPAFQNRYRPIVYYDYFSLAERKGGNQRNSMYSGHVASAVASTFFMVKVYSDYHPEMGSKKYLYYALASIPPLVEGYFRVKALAHFPSDVMVGFLIGAATGIIVPEFHKYKDRQFHLGLNYSPMSGAGISLAWNPNNKPKKSHAYLTSFSKAAYSK